MADPTLVPQSGERARRLSERDEMAVMAVLCLSSACAAAFALLMRTWLVVAFYAAWCCLFFVFAWRATHNGGRRCPNGHDAVAADGYCYECHPTDSGSANGGPT